MPLLLKILGVKAIGTIIGLLVLLTKSSPGFTPIVISIEKDSVIIETSLKKCFSKGLDEIIMSGSEVAIFYSCWLFEKDPEENVRTIAEKSLYQSITFYPAENRFHVSIGSDSLIILTEFEQAKTAVSSVKMSVVSLVLIQDNNQYSIKIDAMLNTI
ncbi:hypothetical protein KAX97_10295, partial [candidate division WOR-3 bacterium]|nr:hypothetical protein [candidate division WOR-3 bacterium]